MICYVFSDDDSDQESKNMDTLEEVENPLNSHRFNFQETLFIPNALSFKRRKHSIR